MASNDLSTLGNPYITASGTSQFSDVIIWPFSSGVNVDGNLGFSEDVDALLTGINAQFGFNNTPHRYTLTWAMRCFTDSGPTSAIINQPVDFIVGSFRIRGRVVHYDVQKSDKGKFVSTSIEDVRRDLNRVIIDTFGLFDQQQTPASIANNVIDVHHFQLTNNIDRDPKALRLLREHGATWSQIKLAIENAGGNLVDALPDDRFIFDRLGQDKADAYRWSFRTTPLLNAIVKIFTDLAYDVYWSTDEERLRVIDRQQRISIGVDKIPGIATGDNITQLKTGVDEGERPTSVQVIGGKMQGVIGGGDTRNITTTGGVFPTSSSVALNINEGYTFSPAWRNASVFYFGADGTQQEDNPTDEELSAALKGIEWWAQKKANVTSADQAIASRIDNDIIYPRDGIVYDNLSGNSASGVGLIPNRGTTEDKWVVEWYNRVRNFAQNNYARTYFLNEDSDLFAELDRFEVLDEGWCGLENEAEGSAFNTGYTIDGNYRWLAPFWNEESNKLRPWMFIPGTPFWGLDGLGVPAQFTAWNEDSTNGVYVPLEVRKWNRSSSRLTNDASLLPAERADRGLIIRLPNTCFSGFPVDGDVASLRIPQYLRGQFLSETTFDLTIDPITQGAAYPVFTSGVNIPVEMYERYGTQKPSRWSAGSPVIGFSRAEVQQRDELIPWSFDPRGTNNTVQLLDLEGRGVASGRIVDRSTVDFLEASAVGLPLITFDQYADEDGIATHGITNLSLGKQANGWWATRYSAKTHFPQQVQVKPIPEEVLEDFRFALHRVNERFNRPPAPLPFSAPEIFNPKVDDGREFLEFPKKESLELLVTISDIIPVSIGTGLQDIAYAGVDENGVKWPAAYRASQGGALNPNSRLAQFRNAFAVDGFFQKGMQATYHYEELDNGDIVHYFTGGVALSQARIVTALDSPSLVNGVWRVDVEIAAETYQQRIPNSDPIQFNNVQLEAIRVTGAPFSDNNNVDTTISANDRILLSGTGQENGNMLKPTFNSTQSRYEIDVGDEAPNNQKDKLVLLSAARGGASTQFATVTQKPNLTTGRGGHIQTISSLNGGTSFQDERIVDQSTGNPGTQYFVDFVGIEYNQIAIGDPCIVIQETEPAPTDAAVAAVTPTKIRLLTYINKPLFTATDAFGTST